MNSDKAPSPGVNLGLYIVVTVISMLLLLGSVLMVTSKLEGDIDFTRQEIEGVNQVEAFYNHTLLLQRIRGLQQLGLEGGELRRGEVERYGDSLVAGIEASMADPNVQALALVDDLQVVRRNFVLLRSEPPVPDANTLSRFDDYSALIDELLLLLSKTAENSRLELDPNVKNHLLSQLLVHHLPYVTESLAKIRGLSAYVRQLENGAPGVGAELDRMIFLYQDRQEHLRQLLSRLQHMLSADEQDLFEQIKQNVDEIELLVLKVSETGRLKQTFGSPRQLFDEVSGRIDALQQSYNQAAGLLSERLMTRLATEERRLMILIFGALLAALIFLATIINLYRRNWRALVALQASETRQRSIFESVVDGLITIDEKGVVQDFNPAAEMIFGYSTDEVVGRKVNMLMPEKYAREHDTYMQNYYDTGYARVIGIGREVEGRRKDGTVFPLELAVNELWVGDKRLFSGIVRDITERKRIERMKNEFISTVSHELRTPLTSIRGSLGLLAGNAVGELSPQAQEMLKIASNNTERLLLLINEILDIQKIESGVMGFHFESVDLTSFLDEARRAHSAYADQYGVRLVIRDGLEGVRVFADKGRLMQVMANLISNAVKFSPTAGEVELGVSRHAGSIRISVTDHGPGIAPEFMPMLFEKFTQSDASDTRQKGGTGLGLAISKVIVEKHGGEIRVDTAIGEGTVFHVELPELLEGLEPVDGYVAHPRASEKKAAILIVEDDRDVAQLLQRMMADAGYAADVAHDATQARRLLAQRPQNYKLMTLDVTLPDEDGISFLLSVRENPRLRDLPVLIVSAKADEARQRLGAAREGVLDCISKPFDQTRLINAINQVAQPDRLPRILHVEDETDVHKVVNSMLRGRCELIWTTTLAAAGEALAHHEFDLVLLDVRLPDGSGLDLMEAIKRYVTPPRVVIFSAYEVPREYAEWAQAVLLKADTSNRQLYEALLSALQEG